MVSLAICKFRDVCKFRFRDRLPSTIRSGELVNVVPLVVLVNFYNVNVLLMADS